MRASARTAAAQASASHALDELQTLTRHLMAWGAPPSCLVIDPLLVRPDAEYYGNCLFELRLTGGESSVLVGTGGRYDALVRKSWGPAAYGAGPPPGAAGLTLNLERIVARLAARRAATLDAGPSAGNGAYDVLVVCRGPAGMMELRMALVAGCWSTGVRATLLARESPTLTEQYEFAAASHIRWLVIVEEERVTTTNTAKVKSLDQKKEISVAVTDVPRYMREALLGQSRSGPGPVVTATRRDSNAVLEQAAQSSSFMSSLGDSRSGPVLAAISTLSPAQQVHVGTSQHLASARDQHNAVTNRDREHHHRRHHHHHHQHQHHRGDHRNDGPAGHP